MALPNPLRSITVRLNTTPVEDLPRYAGFLASSILSCAETIRTAEGQKGDASVLLHKLKTRVSSLIQDKTSEGRFTGIVLVKAIIDAGGPQTLTTSGVWARNLLSCLGKQDPPEVKKLCLVTITRIFLLTKDYPALVREITTPALPSFIQTSLGLIKHLATTSGKIERHVLNPLLQPVLQCWLELLHQFPSTFRPLLPQIRIVVLRLVSDETAPEQTRSLAADVLAALHFGAPKDKPPLDWFQTCQDIIESTHQTANRVFRAILEEWTSIKSRQTASINGKVTSEVEYEGGDSLGMPPWVGMQAGCSRIVYLLELLTASLVGKQAQPVSVPIVEVLDLTARLAAVVPPNTTFSLRQNKEIGRDEREELWAQLPRLHEATIKLLETLVHAYGEILKPIMRTICSQIWDVFEANTTASNVRKATYCAIGTLLDKGRIEMMSVDSSNLTALIQVCCSDLRSKLANKSPSTIHDKSAKSTNLALNSQNGSASSTDQSHRSQSDVCQAAYNLLPHVFTHATLSLTASVRANLDRTAILIGHKEAMLASVLNPPAARKNAKIAPSILPFLARTKSKGLAFEALVRPRMPVITNNDISSKAVPDEDSEDRQMPTDQVDVPMQLEEDEELSVPEAEQHPLDQLAVDSGLTKKRDFASVESETISVPSPNLAAAKRPRTEELLPARIAETSSNLPSLQGHGTLSQTMSTKLGPLEDSMAQEAVTASVSSSILASAKSSEKTFERSALSNIVIKPTTTNEGGGGSDDDDEIPTIDATLTSDSEDEDEEIE